MKKPYDSIMPITRITPKADLDSDISLDVFQVQEAIEVYDGTLALAVDHLLNHIEASDLGSISSWECRSGTSLEEASNPEADEKGSTLHHARN